MALSFQPWHAIYLLIVYSIPSYPGATPRATSQPRLTSSLAGGVCVSALRGQHSEWIEEI